jgi:hypothetical protein
VVEFVRVVSGGGTNSSPAIMPQEDVDKANKKLALTAKAI